MTNQYLRRTFSVLLVFSLLITIFTSPVICSKNLVYGDELGDEQLALLFVNYDTRGGVLKNENEKRGEVIYSTPFGNLPKLKKRKGYSFKGWYTKKKGGEKITEKSIVSTKKPEFTLYARWHYKIKLNANKGTVKQKSKRITNGTKYGNLPQPKRSGYKFKGWYTKKKGGKKVRKTTYVSKYKKHTLYAHWKKRS